jgi:hypothetical protein
MPERLRGCYIWDAKGMAYTELHENYELSEDGWNRLELHYQEHSSDGKVGNITKYYHFDQQSVATIEQMLLDLLIDVRTIRKANPSANILFKVSK